MRPFRSCRSRRYVRGRPARRKVSCGGVIGRFAEVSMSWRASRWVIATFLSSIALVMTHRASAQTAGAGSARATYDFNPGWRLLVGDPKGAEAADFDDSSWQPVT